MWSHLPTRITHLRWENVPGTLAGLRQVLTSYATGNTTSNTWTAGDELARPSPPPHLPPTPPHPPLCQGKKISKHNSNNNIYNKNRVAKSTNPLRCHISLCPLLCVHHQLSTSFPKCSDHAAQNLTQKILFWRLTPFYQCREAPSIPPTNFDLPNYHVLKRGFGCHNLINFVRTKLAIITWSLTFMPRSAITDPSWSCQK